MKAKTKSRSSVKVFSDSEMRIYHYSLLFCLVLVVVGLISFFASFFHSIDKMNEKPVAYVTSSIKISRRCFDKQNSWNILRVNTPIYNGDTIRTDDKSQATIRFEDGMELTLTENTMTVIKLDDEKGLEIALAGGSVFVDSLASEKTATVVYNKTKIATNGKAAVSAAEVKTGSDSKDKKLEVQVLDGKAELKTRGEKAVKVDNGQIVTLATPGKKTQISQPVALEKATESHDLKLIKEKKESLENLSNKKAVFAEDVKKTLETGASAKNPPRKAVATSNMFTSIQSVLDTAAKTQEQNKTASTTAKAVTQQKQTQPKVTQISLVSPANGKVFSDNYFLQNDSISFKWTAVDGATNYKFVLKGPDGKTIVNQVLGNRTSYSFKQLEKLSNGSWVWNVTALKESGSGYTEVAPVKVSTFRISLGSISGETSGGSFYGN